MTKKKRSDPVPKRFANYDEVAEFWDTHDTTDYPLDFRTVKVVSELRNRHYEIPSESDVLKALALRARKKRVSLGHLTGDLLRQRLKRSA